MGYLAHQNYAASGKICHLLKVIKFVIYSTDALHMGIHLPEPHNRSLYNY